MNNIVFEFKKSFFALLGSLILTSCGGSQGSAIPTPDLPIIDYRSAYIFEHESKINRLLIEVSSRLTIETDSNSEEYVLLKEHPRESTFDANRSPYTELVSEESGASFITFIYGMNVDSVIVSRRYAKVTNENRPYTHECRPGRTNVKSYYRNLKSSEAVQVDRYNLFNEVGRSGLFYGVFEYQRGLTLVKIDFPVSLINFNPDQNFSNFEKNTDFQLISSHVPIYLPGDSSTCNAIVPGFLAFRTFDGTAQAIYACEYVVDGMLYFDYACSINISGRLSVYRVL
jgi:hypothetical protein